MPLFVPQHEQQLVVSLRGADVALELGGVAHHADHSRYGTWKRDSLSQHSHTKTWKIQEKKPTLWLFRFRRRPRKPSQGDGKLAVVWLTRPRLWLRRSQAGALMLYTLYRRNRLIGGLIAIPTTLNFLASVGRTVIGKWRAVPADIVPE